MERLVKGDVVVVPFPFSNLSASKRRPALVLANLQGDDILLCQITSQSSVERTALPIKTEDFINGSLPSNSFIRSMRLFTGDKTLIIRKAGTISAKLMDKVINNIISILKEDT